MKKDKYKPLYADIKEEIENSVSLNDAEVIEETPEDQISKETISKVLVYRKSAKWIFIAANIPMLFSIIAKSASLTKSYTYIIFTAMMYALGIWGSVISIKLYKVMKYKYGSLALFLSIACPLISFWYISEFLRDSKEYLLNNCSEKTFEELKIK